MEKSHGQPIQKESKTRSALWLSKASVVEKKFFPSIITDVALMLLDGEYSTGVDKYPETSV